MSNDKALADRIRSDRATGALEACLAQFQPDEHVMILNDLRLLCQDIKRYGWDYLEGINKLKEQGYETRPLEDLYLIQQKLQGLEEQ